MDVPQFPFLYSKSLISPIVNKCVTQGDLPYLPLVNLSIMDFKHNRVICRPEVRNDRWHGYRRTCERESPRTCHHGQNNYQIF